MNLRRFSRLRRNGKRRRDIATADAIRYSSKSKVVNAKYQLNSARKTATTTSHKMRCMKCTFAQNRETPQQIKIKWEKKTKDEKKHHTKIQHSFQRDSFFFSSLNNIFRWTVRNEHARAWAEARLSIQCTIKNDHAKWKFKIFAKSFCNCISFFVCISTAVRLRRPVAIQQTTDKQQHKIFL